MTNEHKILLALGNSIGDAICFTPAIYQLKKANASLTLDLMINSKPLAELFSYDPNINKIILSPKKEGLKLLWQEYDFVIAFPMTADCIYDLKRLGLPTFYPGYYHKPHAEQALDLIRFLFPECKEAKIEGYHLYPQKKHFEEAEHLLQEAGADLSSNEILIGCHIGYSGLAANQKSWFQRVIRKKYGSRVWPPFNYAKLLNRLSKQNERVRFVMTGTQAESKMVNKFFRRHKHQIYNLCGKTSLLTMAALMKRLNYFVSGDTGPMHFAVAMEIPMLVLFSERTSLISQPYPPTDYRETIIKTKISQITVNEVSEKIIDALSL